MRSRDDILTEVDYLAMITQDCAEASAKIQQAHASLALGKPLLVDPFGSRMVREVALEVTFEELTEAQAACHRLVKLVEGRLRMITSTLDEDGVA